AFLAGWLILIILSGGGYYYYRRNAMRQFLDRFRRRPFELIQPNPFIVGNPIRSKEMFFGREDDFRFVKNKVDIERYGSLIVLFGERRAGKTSVMYQILGGRLGPHYLPVFVDMQAMAVNDDWEFLGRIAELTAKAAARYKRQFDLNGFEDRSRNPFATFERFIDSLIETIGQDKLLFLVDEYELIENKVVEGKISKDIFLFLSGLVEHKPGLFLVFAGTHLLQEREPVYWQTLLQRCDYRNISFLTPNDARRLVQEPVAGQVFYLGSSVARILRLTAGQPFYTQLVCRNVVEFLNAEQRNYFYEDDVASIVREIVDNPPPQMIYFWAGLGLEERLVLAALAEHCRNSEHYAGLNDLSVLLRKPSAPAPEAVRLVLDNLCAREILEPNLNRRFRFRMDLFRHWIREEHNLNKLLREIEHGAAVTNQNHWRVEQ
ncbi:ATP-binding protein, partial [bacterium]|nr:ATP-binding protein [bacterium]